MISLRHLIKHMFTFEHLCWRYKYCLSLIGCWPPLYSKRQLFKRFFVNLCIVTLILIQIFALITSANEFDAIIEILSYLLPLLGMDTPYFAVYVHIEKTLYFYNHCITDWRKLESEEERNIFRNGFATVTSLNLLFYGVQHGCALFEYVGYKLEHLIDENEFNQDIPISRIYEKIHQRIINNVNLHKRAIERMVPWYLLTPTMQKEGILIMIRSMKPCYLTIGKMFVSSHELFTSIVRTAISYATIVHSLE
ncbi:hypothetical protein HZH68_011159 [Vespula germanica]|uniref:Odorant receptor n=1 Tax=Vespula germanica TaxID=30212 RepID=A0A834JQ65_VESGE|nr:hypothetical protein HZH68_011159 [Vespula germanica]